MRSVMTNQFSRVPGTPKPRSVFDRSFGVKTTFNAGELIPFYWDEILPGDTFNVRLHSFARLATPIVPFMDNLYMDTFFFFVPNRLTWNNFQKFMGEQDNPGDSIDYLTPVVTAPTAGWALGSIADYFGLPTGISAVEPFNPVAFYFRAYNLIWNQWFRDENLQNSVSVPKTDGPDAYTLYNILKRGKRFDYFTSALPNPQKGPSVPIPITGEIPIKSKDYTGAVTNAMYVNAGTGGQGGYLKTDAGTLGAPIRADWASAVGINVLRWQQEGDHTGNAGAGYNYGDLDAVEADINALRQAIALQQFLERDARGGTRYVELNLSHFGVVSPDARLQRPEYLGGGSTPVNIHPIAQTSAVDDQPTPQGNLAAIGTASIRGHGFTKSFVEHGVVLGLLSVRADLNYQQGINRMFMRRTRYDYYWPDFAHLGEQVVYNQEIFYEADSAANLQAWGYNERYAEYRYKPSIITGRFRSTAAQPLDQWHLAQEFASLPALNATFIQDNPPVERVVAVTDEPQFLFDSIIKQRCVRPIPLNGVPGLRRL